MASQTRSVPESPASRLSDARRIWRIAGAPVRFALLYILLMVPWPGWDLAYGKAYASVAAFVFDSDDPFRTVRIRHIDQTNNPNPTLWGQDTGVTLEVRKRSVGMREVPPNGTARSSHYMGWAPTALVIALVVATPISWRRRAFALPWGVILASGFSLLMIAVWIYGWFYAQEWIALHDIAGDYESRVKLMASVLNLSGDMGPYYIAPVFIWVLVTLRRGDLYSIFSLRASSSSPSSASP